MSYVPGPQDDWADWDGPTPAQAPAPQPERLPSHQPTRTMPLGVYGRGAPEHVVPDEVFSSRHRAFGFCVDRMF